MRDILALVNWNERDRVRNAVLRDRVRFFGIGLLVGFFATIVLLAAANQ